MSTVRNYIKAITKFFSSNKDAEQTRNKLIILIRVNEMFQDVLPDNLKDHSVKITKAYCKGFFDNKDFDFDARDFDIVNKAKAKRWLKQADIESIIK
jgi:hypothetical protein